MRGNRSHEFLNHPGPPEEQVPICPFKGAEPLVRRRGNRREGTRHALQHPIGSNRMIRQANPGGGGGLLHIHQRRPVKGRVIWRQMPHDFFEKPRRDNDREHPGRARQRSLQRFGINKPEGQVDRGSGDSILVIVDFPRMQGHPQADPLLASTRAVVCFQRRCQGRRQRFDEQALRHFGRDQHEHPVAAVLASLSIPGDSDLLERFPDRAVKTVTNR